VDDIEYHKKRNPKGNNQWTSALESPNTIRASPSLYEGAFRLESASSPSSLFHPSLMFGRDERRKEEDIADGDDSPMSSPVDESYKIRIPRGSLSPRSHDDDDQMKTTDESEAAQDLSLSAGQHDTDYCKMDEESLGEDRSEPTTEEDHH